jgi:hypothetical protein
VTAEENLVGSASYTCRSISDDNTSIRTIVASSPNSSSFLFLSTSGTVNINIRTHNHSRWLPYGTLIIVGN